jgi:hypothetical protein
LATARAMTGSVIMRLDKAAVVRVLHDEPAFSEMLMSYLLARNARVEEDLVDQLSIRAKAAARTLLLMAGSTARGRPERSSRKSVRDTREMVGTTRSRVSVFMNNFVNGLLTTTVGVEANSSLLNVILHSRPSGRRAPPAAHRCSTKCRDEQAPSYPSQGAHGIARLRVSTRVGDHQLSGRACIEIENCC